MQPILKLLIVMFTLSTSVACAEYADLPESAQKTLNDGQLAAKILVTYREYTNKYANKTSGDAEKVDRESMWNALDSYAKQFWIIHSSLKVGEQINDYPGILAHGTIRWNSETKRYDLALGLWPFDAGDGLGQFTVTFDLKGVISGVHVHKYPW